MSHVTVPIDAAGGPLSIRIRAGLQMVRYRADYRVRLANGQQSEWILIDYFNGGEGENENNTWPIADSSALPGADLCVQFLVARASGGGHPYQVDAEIIDAGGASLGILEFEGVVDQDAVPLVAWFDLESGQ